jgi:splicing factor 45
MTTSAKVGGESVIGSVTSQGATISAAAVVFATPQMKDEANSAIETEPTRATQSWGKKVKPPAMVLDEDVNGFQSRGKSGRSKGAGAGGNSKRKGKKVWRVTNAHYCCPQCL